MATVGGLRHDMLADGFRPAATYIYTKTAKLLKRCGPCKKGSMKKVVNQRWWPRSGCGGLIMAKFLIVTI